MKNALAIIGALTVMGAASVAMAEAKQDFTLVNATGYTIDQVYVAPTKSNDWEEDVLGRDALGNKDSVHITFSRGDKTCNWDLKVVYDDGETAEWEKFDLCTVSKITIKYNRSSGSTSAVYE
jgi:hypothetical protein